MVKCQKISQTAGVVNISFFWLQGELDHLRAFLGFSARQLDAAFQGPFSNCRLHCRHDARRLYRTRACRLHVYGVQEKAVLIDESAVYNAKKDQDASRFGGIGIRLNNIKIFFH